MRCIFTWKFFYKVIFTQNKDVIINIVCFKIVSLTVEVFWEKYFFVCLQNWNDAILAFVLLSTNFRGLKKNNYKVGDNNSTGQYIVN